jgi:hypothetical protein
MRIIVLALLLAGCTTTSDSGAGFCFICFKGHVKTSSHAPEAAASGVER